jgi:hypothetical protein
MLRRVYLIVLRASESPQLVLASGAPPRWRRLNPQGVQHGCFKTRSVALARSKEITQNMLRLLEVHV